MAEDDRAAKAARARAMLKKRQQQKATGGVVSPSVAAGESIYRIATPSPPPSRTYSPAPPEVVSPKPTSHVPIPLSQPGIQGETGSGYIARDSRDLGDLFAQGGGNAATDNDWLSSLTPVDGVVQSPTPRVPQASSPQVASPSPAAARPQSIVSPRASLSSPPPRSSPTKPGETDDLRTLIQDQARTIAALESEKGALSSSVEQLKDVESRSVQTQRLLDEERRAARELRVELESTKAEVHRLVARDREQEGTITSLHSEKAALDGRVRTLEHTATELKHADSLLRKERENGKNAQASIERLQKDFDKALMNAQEQQRRIASLESEGGTLRSSLQELDTIRSHATRLEKELADARQSSDSYQSEVNELQGQLEDMTGRSEQQQQTISFLVSEKTTLTSQLERLQSAESDLAETAKLLEVERTRAERLQSSVQQLEAQKRDYSSRADDLTARERELTDKTRDQDREIKMLTTAVAELRTQASNSGRRVRELEEQIEGDDRAERLEATLQHTQDRAAELEFQVYKLKQGQAALKAERDDLEGRLRAQTDSEVHWQTQHAEAQKANSSTKEQLSFIASERDTLLQGKAALQSQVDELRASLTEVQQKLTQTAAEMVTAARALQQTQAELRNANRRADEAEQIQKDLRTEGMGLMRSLDEMRPKIVELTDVKLELGEKTATLEQAVRSRDATIAQLESSLDELRDQYEDLQKEHRSTRSTLERERFSSTENTTELQKAYADLQNELQATKASVKHLEEERGEYRNMASRNLEEVDRLSTSLQASGDQITALRAELIERSDARHEAQEFLEHAREEMEALRVELVAKESEIERLQEAASSSLDTDAAPHSWDEEMLSALKQQHDLDLSAAQSEIRHLETVVFQAEAKAHSLQRQVSTLEDQLAHYRPLSRGPGVPRTTSRVGISDELRRSSFGSHRPSNLAAPPSDFEGLSPETRHKRKVSLSMLKARIDSEVAVSKAKGMSPAQRVASLPGVAEYDEDSSRSSPVIVNSARRAPQFLDESHVFWCSSCHGDLVIL